MLVSSFYEVSMAAYQFAVQKASCGLLLKDDVRPFTRSTGSSSMAFLGGAGSATLVGGLKPFIAFGLRGAYGLDAAPDIDGPETGEEHPVRPFWKHLPDKKSSRGITWSISNSLLPTVKLAPSASVSTDSIPWALPDANLGHRVRRAHIATNNSRNALSTVCVVEKCARITNHL